MKVKEKILATVIAVTAVNGFFSTNMFKKYNNMYKDQITELKVSNRGLKKRLSEYQEYGIIVDVTMYQPDRIQCDDTPDITADGTRIRIHKASEYKFVALSRNLLKRWGGPFDYGDYIIVEGCNGKYDGIWQVKDTMNDRFRNRIDFLQSKGTKLNKFDNAVIYKYEKMSNAILANN